MAELFGKLQCTYCQEDASGLRVKCVECAEFELCLQCFSAGAEIGPHRNDHSYQFVDCGAVGVSFGKHGWSAPEELHLLDAVEAYGFGNWEDISRHIETRSPEEAKEQYTSRYLEGTIGRLTWPPALSLRPNLTDAANLDSGPLSPSAAGRLPPLDVSAEEAKQLVYMPLRDDFESEHDNEAECLLSPLFINETEEDDLDLAMTLVQVDVYVQKLRERTRRKRVARDYQLISQFFNSTTRKDKIPPKKTQLTREEKEFQEGMRVFCQFHTASEHEQFLCNMQREQELKLRLAELARYRRNGITRHEECAHLDHHSMDSSGVNPNRPPLLAAAPTATATTVISGLTLPQQVSTYLRRRERSEDPALSSTERRSMSASLGSPSLTKGEGAAAAALAAGKLLSRHETNICAALALTPAEYLALKAALLKDGSASDGESGPEGGVERAVHMFLAAQTWVPA